MNAVYCCFQWNARQREWKFIRTIILDDNDRPIDGTLTPDRWLSKTSKDGTSNTIPGRLVTRWTMWGGIDLHDFNPPTPLPAWLSKFAIDEIVNSEEWMMFIEGSMQIYETTEEHVAQAIKVIQ